LTSSKKAVEISISNYTPETRVIENPIATNVEAYARVGTIESLVADDALAAAAADQLVVLFANNANKVEQAFALEGLSPTDGNKYRFHDIKESVTQVAVVRDATATKAADGSWVYKYDIAPESYVGKDLQIYKGNALIEYNVNFGIEGMDLFAVSGIETDGTKCTFTDKHDTTFEYILFTAIVDVKPMLARVEITNVQCTDLGQTTAAAASGDTSKSGGYDHLTLGELTFGTNKTYNFNNYVLKGAYCGTAKVNDAVCDAAAKNYYDQIFNGENNGKGIVWNISVNTPYPTVKTVTEGSTTKDVIDSNPLTIKMTAFAHDYKVVNTDKQLSVGFKGASSFEAGKIYRIAIPFTESNLDTSNEAICVEVQVLIANWVVVPITPVFGK
jgi:hypothetical protein